MGKQIQLNIADPCHENWENMTQADQGRFCASCQKQVIDFTNMSDSQLAAFFKKPTEGSVCGRFFQDQLDRNIEIPKKRIPWVKYFFQFALPAFLVSMKATAQGNVKAISTTRPLADCSLSKSRVAPEERIRLTGDTTSGIVPKQNDLSVLLKGKPKSNLQAASSLISLKGVIMDQDNNPVPFASVIIRGTKIGVAADSVGVFRIEKIQVPEEVILQVSSVGYEPKELQIDDAAVPDKIVIHLNKQVMKEVVVLSYGYVTRKTVTGTSSVKKERNIINTSIAKFPTELPPMIKVYPNPVASGTNINIGCQKLNEGYYSIQLTTQSGQQVLIKQTWIDGDVQVLNIDIPNVATGVYFLKLTNRETNKRFTQKIVVQ